MYVVWGFILVNNVLNNSTEPLDLSQPACYSYSNFWIILHGIELIGSVKLLLFKNPALEAQYQQLFTVLKYVVWWVYFG